MARYILLWELDSTRTPDDPKERQKQWRTFQDMVVERLESGETKDWGKYVGEGRGYAIIEGTEMDAEELGNTYFPYVTFEVKQIISIEQAIEVVKAMA